MKATLPKPRPLVILRFLLPLVAGVTFFVMLGAAEPELTPELLGGAGWSATRGIERGWVDQALPADYLPALVLEPPCRLENAPEWSAAAFAAFRGQDEKVLAELAADHPGSWLPPLLLSQVLAERGAEPRALDVLRRFAAGPGYRRLAESRSLPVDDQRAMIHFWHRLAYLQHQTNSRDTRLFWQSLKNPIGRVKVLSAAGAAGLPKDAPTWDEHRLYPPGCSSARLTSFDLYNNLLVAYLEVPGFQETKKSREQEFARGYRDSAEQNPWQAALERARQQELGRREGFVWAISNAEKLLRDRRANRLGPPENAHLALNLALLASEAAALAPEVREPFWQQIGNLIDQAASGPATADFGAGLARLRLLRQIELPGVGGILPSPPAAGAAVTDTIARVTAAAAVRRDPAAILAILDGEKKLPELGEAASAWRTALRQDVAAAIAARVPPSASPSAREAAVEEARRVLRGASPPRELSELEASLPLAARLGSGWGGAPFRLFASLLAAAVLFLLWHLAERELLCREYLFTSFYRREAERIPRS